MKPTFRWRKGTGAGKLQALGTGFIGLAAVLAAIWHTGWSSLAGIVPGVVGFVLVVIGILWPEPPPPVVVDAAALLYQLKTDDGATYVRVKNTGKGEARNLTIWALLSPRYYSHAAPEGPTGHARILDSVSLKPGSEIVTASVDTQSYQLISGRSRLPIALSWEDDSATHTHIETTAVTAEQTI